MALRHKIKEYIQEKGQVTGIDLVYKFGWRSAARVWDLKTIDHEAVISVPYTIRKPYSKPIRTCMYSIA